MIADCARTAERLEFPMMRQTPGTRTSRGLAALRAAVQNGDVACESKYLGCLSTGRAGHCRP